ncbi:hypothetical protein V6N11_051233 [Hibiscus sabdariffa]|uniref:Uncharacterized protein n=1 Tax=Hibiscus sabdariffa TaxID=183260 RepID=A0ABR1Z9P7_9ROSI
MDQPFSLPCISLAPLDLCYMDQQILSAIAVIAMRTKLYMGVGSGGGSQTSGNCEVRGLGVVDRNARSKSEHMDVMRCVQLDMVQESPELHTAPILCEAGGESPVAMLELE